MNQLPRRKRGRQSIDESERYARDRAAFCGTILQIASTLDFKVSARGWAYIFENRGVINKDEIDACQDLINECRKDGSLPLDICSADEARAFSNVEAVDDHSPQDAAERTFRYIQNAHHYYNPVSFWDYQVYYVQMVVEKIDLKSLFKPVCAENHVPIANAKGWGDIGLRADMMRRFRDHEGNGRRPVLLYCGDFDPAGFVISDFLRSNMADLANAVGWRPDNVVIERFGLNADFITEHKLTWVDNLITGSGRSLDDPKHPDHRRDYVQRYLAEYGARKVEANALVVRPEAGRNLCRDVIERFISPAGVAAFNKVVAERRREAADHLRKLLAAA